MIAASVLCLGTLIACARAASRQSERAPALATRADTDWLLLDRSIGWVNEGVSSAPIWLRVGDSARVRVNETVCDRFSCGIVFATASDSGWSVDDSSVVRLVTPTASPARTDPRDMTSRYRARFLLNGLRPGRTTIRAHGVRSPYDTVPSRTPSKRALSREVIVTLPFARIDVVPRPPVLRAGQSFVTELRLFDTNGHEITGYPMLVEIEGERGTYGVRSGSGLTLGSPRPGRRRVIVRVPALADTLFVTAVDSAGAPPR